MNSIYIHIPFCKKKCHYCAFCSYAGMDYLHAPYIEAVAKEMESVKDFKPQTLYIGGGTPSVLNAENLRKLFNAVRNNFGRIEDLKEATFEANPESLTGPKLQILKDFGFNRISMGLQSTQDKILKTLGRVHNYTDFLTSYNQARRRGFSNINIDLIAGVPGQSMDDFKQDIANIVGLGPQHLSVYGLQVEEGTEFCKQGIKEDQEIMRQMLDYAREELTKKGFVHYEISNYARPGFESVHNSNYWTAGSYLGFGAGAASYNGGTRSSNTTNVVDYIEKTMRGAHPVESTEHLTGKEKEGELFILALRQISGVEPSAKVMEYFGKEIKKLLDDGMLEKDGKKIRLSSKDIFLANEVFCSFVAPF